MNIVWFSDLDVATRNELSRIAVKRIGVTYATNSVLDRINASLANKYGICLVSNRIVSRKKFSLYQNHPEHWYIAPNHAYAVTRFQITVGANKLVPLTVQDLIEMGHVVRSYIKQSVSKNSQVSNIQKNSTVNPVVIYSAKQEFSQFFRAGTRIADITATLARRGVNNDEDVILFDTVTCESRPLFVKVVTTSITMNI